MELLLHANSTRLKQLFGTYNLLVLDEVQRLENAGLLLKIMADPLKTLHVMDAGSLCHRAIVCVVRKPLSIKPITSTC